MFKFIKGTSVTMMGRYILLILFAFLVEGVFGDEVKSVKEGDRVPLNTDVTKGPDDVMLWYFNNILIALINGESSKSCLYYGPDGRFRDILDVDYETGSLIITNSRTEHSGRYGADIIRKQNSGKNVDLNVISKCDHTKITNKSINLGEIIKSFSLTVSADKSEEQPQKEPQNQKFDATVPDSGLSSAAVAGICAFVVLLTVVAAAPAVIYYRRRSSRNDMEKNKQGVL